MRLNFKVVEGGVNVVGIWKKITRRVFLAIPTNPGSWS